jgi:hypothetical protein
MNYDQYNTNLTNSTNNIKEYLLELYNQSSSLFDELKSVIYRLTHKLYPTIKNKKEDYILLNKKIVSFDENIKIACYNKISDYIEDIINFFTKNEIFDYYNNILNLNSESISELENLINSLESTYLLGIFQNIHIQKINNIIKILKKILHLIEKYKLENYVFTAYNNLWKNLYIFKWDNIIIKIELSEFKNKIAYLDHKYNMNYKNRSKYFDIKNIIDKMTKGDFLYKNYDDKDAILNREHFKIWGM